MYQADILHVIQRASSKFAAKEFRVNISKGCTWGSSRLNSCFINHCEDNYAIYNCVTGYMEFVAYFLHPICRDLMSFLYRYINS